MEHQLIIEGTLPNLNEYIKQLNISKFRGNAMKKNSEGIITVFIKEQLKGIEIQEPVFIDITWIEPNAKRDKDNIAFAKKFIFDALVRNKVLKNDNWERIVGFSDHFDIDRANPRIEVTIRKQEQSEG